MTSPEQVLAEIRILTHSARRIEDFIGPMGESIHRLDAIARQIDDACGELAGVLLTVMTSEANFPDGDPGPERHRPAA